MSTATAWSALQDALATTEPACLDDPRFTSETGQHDSALVEICRVCPVRSECAAWARTAPRNHLWGFYAGLVRRTKPNTPDRRVGVRTLDRIGVSETFRP